MVHVCRKKDQKRKTSQRKGFSDRCQSKEHFQDLLALSTAMPPFQNLSPQHFSALLSLALWNKRSNRSFLTKVYSNPLGLMQVRVFRGWELAPK